MAEAAYLEFFQLGPRPVSFDPGTGQTLVDRQQQFVLLMVDADEALHWTFKQAADAEAFARRILRILQDD